MADIVPINVRRVISAVLFNTDYIPIPSFMQVRHFYSQEKLHKS